MYKIIKHKHIDHIYDMHVYSHSCLFKENTSWNAFKQQVELCRFPSLDHVVDLGDGPLPYSF